ncbi:hypothetical protein [Vampirovibrio chlorellavorus]|uniref:hypothetical protein n=1 Tax=Vampirovibrio chlorellavorus TaxID=758823 RepID=UPI0026E98981|nr:hypothetical protein [Vampirovibrio chlorellavorus]
MIVQGVFSHSNPLSGIHQTTRAKANEATVHQYPAPPSGQDKFQRQAKGLTSGLPPKPFLGQVLWPRQTESPKRQVTAGKSPKASAEKADPQPIPPAPPLNPIAFERAKALLKALSTEHAPTARALLKNGHPEGLKQLLLISNRLVSDVNGLRKQGRQNIRFVFYVHDPALKAIRDPEFDQQNPELSDDLSLRYYFSKPQILADQDRLHPPLRYHGPKPLTPVVDAKNRDNGLSHLDFTPEELQTLKATARSAGFTDSEAHFNEYLKQLFNQVENLYAQWLTLSQQDHGIQPLRLGLYSDNLPTMRYIIRGKRKEPPIRDPKGWHRLDDPRRHWQIHEVTQLFPACDVQGYHKAPPQARLNLESKMPFWYERKQPRQ